MLRTIMMAVIMAAGLLGVCWMLVEYWLRSSGQILNEEVSVLSVWGKMAFAFEHFCRVIRKGKDLKELEIGEELGRVPMEEEKNISVLQESKNEKVKDGASKYRAKRYRIKENM